MPEYTARPKAKLAGQDLARAFNAELESIVVDTRSGAADMFALRFRDVKYDMLDSPLLKIGAPLTISVSTPGGKEDLTAGELMAVEVEYDATGQYVVLRGLDKTHKLHRGRKTRTWLNQTYSQIASQVAGEAGLGADVEATPAVHDWVAQVNQSDIDFLRSLAAEIGFEVAVDFKTSTLRFKKLKGAALGQPISLKRGENLIEFQAARTGADQPLKVVVYGWDPEQKKDVKGQGDVNTVSFSLGDGTTPKTIATKLSSPDYDLGLPWVGAEGRATKLAQSIATRLGERTVRFSGLVEGDPKLRAGSKVKLDGIGKALDGTYVLTSAKHLLDPNEGYFVEVSATGLDDPSLLASMGVADHSQANGLGAHGVAPGVVTDIKDPKKLGRVKVKLPWLPGGNFETDWARLVQISAGNKYGSYFVPEVGDEVLVTFDGGDLRRPYVLGGLFNGTDKPHIPWDKVVKNGEVVRHGIYTKGKYRLMFHEESGTEEAIELSTGDDNYVLRLDKEDKKITLESKESNATVEITAGKDITVKAGGKLVIEAQQDVELKASGNFKVQATGNVELKATGQATLEGQGGVGVKSSGVAEVKGSMVNLG